MTRTRRPGLAMYLLMEAGLIVSLAYLTLIGGGFAGVYFYAPRLLSQVILGIVGGGWLASKFVRKEPWPTTPIDRPLLAALGVVTLSTLFSSHPRLSLENAPLIFAYAFAFWLLYEKIQAPWFADLLLKCAFAVVGITCLVASTEFISWYLGLPDGPSWPSLGLGLWPTQVPRIGMESLGSPNHLSAYLAPLIPLVVARGAASSRRIERLGLWLLALLMLGLIGVSQSRGGLLGALGGLIALAVGGWTRLGKRWPRLRPTRWRVAAALSLLGAALTGLVAALAMWRISTARVRVHLWSAALKMTAHRPLLGIGPGSFGLEYLRYRDAARFTKVFSQAHNIYLHTLATLGIGGALASGWLLWSLVSAALRLWRSESSRTQRWIRLGAMAGLSAFATHGLFDALSLKFPAAFHVVILLTALALRPASPSPALSRKRWWWPKPAMAAALLAVGVVTAAWSNAGFSAFDQALAASRRGDWSEAAEVLNVAVQRDPAYRYYRLQLGLTAGRLAADDADQLGKAIAAYESAGIDHDYYALNHANLAWLLWESGERTGAILEMTRAVELEGSDPDYRLNLGLMLEETGRIEAAHAEYAQAILRKPELLRLSFWDEGQSEARSREHLAQAAMSLLQSHHSGPSSQLQAQIAYLLDDWDEALHHLQAALNESPEDPDLWVELGKTRLAMGNPAEALIAADQALNVGPPTNRVFRLRSQAHLALGDLDAADADLKILSFLSPGYQTSLLRAQLAQARGESQAAIDSYQDALGSISMVRDPTYAPWVWGRPPVLPDTLPFFRQPRQTEALIEAYLALADLYAQQGLVPEAREAYQAVLAINPSQAEAQAGLEMLP